MKKSLFLLAMLLILLSMLSSCYRYQFFSLQSALLDAQKQAFVAQDDSLEITYKVNGNSQLILEVNNRSNQVKNIDWAQSALIVNDRKLDVYLEDRTFQGTTTFSTNSFGFQNLNFGVGAFSGSSQHTQSLAMLPPRSKVVYLFPSIWQSYYKQQGRKNVSFQTNTGYKMYVKQYSFTAENSPLRLRTYLTIMGNPESKPVVKEHLFYLNEIVETFDSEYLNLIQSTINTPVDTYRFNKFVVSKMTGMGNFMVGVTMVGVIAVAAIVAPDEE
jgi:hypothetical protein